MRTPACLLLALWAFASSEAAEFPKPYNTQPEELPFTKPADALAGIHIPQGFRATLFAAEPDVQQPMGMAMDARGRLWIAENYTYSERALNFDRNLRDRVVILEDSNNDGVSDKRTIFWDQAIQLTSVLPGFGGAFALCPPNLVFIPDANGDDIPDGEPKILLDGFDVGAVRHNIANGLKFGPDGWIYGRHGILATSQVGVPGTPADQRVAVNACIWRCHPVTLKFEVVASGTTNPWGNDWDEFGQQFLINTVIGHLWHVIPGAFYKRMFGEHPNPHLYELIDQTADHFHWDTREIWSDVRKLGVTTTSSERGGGHAHSGLMIYLGDNWPTQYRNTALTVNYHGRRLNNDRLERSGATYVGRHNPDLMLVDDPWFRGIDLLSGPDGGVYVCDWSDIGECHDDNGVHRTSGRVYKVTHGEVKLWKGDLRLSSDVQLAEYQTHQNHWFSRQAQIILHERASKGGDLSHAQAALRKTLAESPDPTKKLRALWSLHVTGGLNEESTRRILGDENEHLRAWAVQLLQDHGPASAASAAAFASLANSEKSGLVLAYLASAMRRATPEQQFEIARGLVSHSEFANDPVLPLLTWHTLESAIPLLPLQSVSLAERSQFPKIRRFITRRLFEAQGSGSPTANQLVQLVATARPPEFQFDVLSGIDDALKGLQKASPPAAWQSAGEILSRSTGDRVRELHNKISAIFGDARAFDRLRAAASDPQADPAFRQRAFATLVQTRAPDLLNLITNLLGEGPLSQDAIRALATLGEPAAPALLLPRFNDFRTAAEKSEAINTLVSRQGFALPLLEAVQRGAIPRDQVGPAQVRQMRSINDADIHQRIASLWPLLDGSPAAQKQRYAKYKSLLGGSQLAGANPARGRAIFQTACASCHTLFGDGGALGPDLTGGDRRNLDYLLDNLLHPSAIVPETYRMSAITMKDERVITGMILNQTERAVTIQTVTEKVTLPKSEIAAIQPSQLSMMPDGLLDGLTEAQCKDLFALLMAEAPPTPKD